MTNRTCTIDGCDRKHYGRGYCNPHYKRWRRYGDPEAGQPTPIVGATVCSHDGCDNTGRMTRGLCSRHYHRLSRYGDPDGGTTPNGLDPSERFASYVDKSGDCWLWTGSRNWDGYGQFQLKDRSVRAHRFAYETQVGPIPDGLEIDHLCRVRACARVDHLEVVTHAENMRRAARARRQPRR